MNLITFHKNKNKNHHIYLPYYTMTTKPHRPAADPDAIAIQTQIDISISKARAIVDSWLPDAHSNPNNNDEDDDHLFVPAPPRLGLGAPIPKDFSARPLTNTLRKTLLDPKALSRVKMTTLCTDKNGIKNNNDREKEDDDIGRSALGDMKRKRSLSKLSAIDHNNKKMSSSPSLSETKTSKKRTKKKKKINHSEK